MAQPSDSYVIFLFVLPIIVDSLFQKTEATDDDIFDSTNTLSPRKVSERPIRTNDLENHSQNGYLPQASWNR